MRAMHLEAIDADAPASSLDPTGSDRSPGPILSTQQRAAVEHQSGGIALTAGAGCGKTTVLTSRFLAELAGDAPPSLERLASLVALTFTDKAARELRLRVRAVCRTHLRAVSPATPTTAKTEESNGSIHHRHGLIPGLLEDPDEDPSSGSRAQAQRAWEPVLRGLEAASIETFHAYCARLLRRFAVEAGLDPEFQILDHALAASVRDAALRACVRRWLAEDPGPDSSGQALRHLAVEYRLDGVISQLHELLRRRVDRDQLDVWIKRRPDEILKGWSRVFDQEVRPPCWSQVRAAASVLLSVIQDAEPTTPKARERRLGLLELLPGWLDPEVILEADHPQLVEVRSLLNLQGSRDVNWPSPACFASVKQSYHALKGTIEKYQSLSIHDEELTRRSAERSLWLARLLFDAVREYERRKQSAGWLDYDDLQDRLLGLLEKSPAVRERIEKPLRRVLVDEFQDTDPIQARLLERLAPPDAPSGRLFLVGDFKQSIYRFRGARPHLFLGFRDRTPASGRLPLSGNYRSVGPILDFANTLFQGAFEVDEPLTPTPSTPHQELDHHLAITMLWSRDEHDEVPTLATERRQVEAQVLAGHLAARLEDGLTVRDGQQIRTAHAGDVVLLFRTLNDAAPYEQALAAVGLDYHVVGGAAFYAQQEVLDLINALSVLEDPLDALALAATLRSPMFGVSDLGLFWLAQTGLPEPPTVSLEAQSIEEIAPEISGDLESSSPDLRAGFEADPSDWPDALPEDDRARLIRARRLITRWRLNKDRLTIAETLEQVLDESGYELALMAEFLADRKRANARKLVRLARRFDQTGGFSLADFVARLRADARTPPREDQAATTDEAGRAVRLMTVHQAKGLEFPIVVVVDVNRDNGPARESVALHDRLGLVLKESHDDRLRFHALSQDDRGGAKRLSKSPTLLGWSCYRTLEDSEDRAEARRLFYVAVTRARDHLILSACLDPERPPSKCSTALDLLAERFDLANGRSRLEPPEGSRTPRVSVVQGALSTSALRGSSTSKAQTRRTKGRGARTLQVASMLSQVLDEAEARWPTGASEDPNESSKGVGRATRLVLDPAHGLTEPIRRADALIRAVLSDPDFVGAPTSETLAEVLNRLGAAQGAAAPRRLRVRIEAMLGPLFLEMLGPALAGARQIEPGFAWASTWTVQGHKRIVETKTDLAWLDDEAGAWHWLFVRPESTADALGQVRLGIAQRRARALVSRHVDRLVFWELIHHSNHRADWRRVTPPDWSDEDLDRIIGSIVQG